MLTPHDIRKIAVTAEVSPQTVKGYLDGRNIRPACRTAIASAVKKLGYQIEPNRHEAPQAHAA